MTTKTLPEWLEFISSTHSSEIDMGLERVRAVFAELNLTQSRAKTVLVAGTNGKGSTVAMIEAGLIALGYRVGAYTSPHIISYNERVRIAGKSVSDATLVNSFKKVESVRKNIPLTYFEYGTLAAFDILLSSDLDVVLLEIGLGGRLDAVNIIEPDISIITSVGIDHSDWLGSTVEQIGLEKAGILRSKSIFIGGEKLPDSVLEKADTLACATLLCRKDFNVENKTPAKTFTFYDGKSKQRLAGFPSTLLPENNVLLSLQAIMALLKLVNNNNRLDEAIYKKIIAGVESLKLPGRLEKIESLSGLEVYVDVGHNPHAAEFLKAFLLKTTSAKKKIQIVYSALVDKDAQGVLSVLSPFVDRCILAPLVVDRAMQLEDLLRCAQQSGMQNMLSFPDMGQAIENALSFAAESERNNEPVLTLIFGSFFIVEAAKRFFEIYD